MFFRKQKPAVNDNRTEPAPAAPAMEAGDATVIGAGAQFNGTLECPGELRIEGTVVGSVRAGRLHLGPSGVIEGDVTAEDMTVEGVIKGPLRGRHIHLMAGSSVEGDLTSETIAIDTGARLTGAVWQEQDAAAEPWSGSGADDGFRPLATVRPRVSLFGR